MQSFQNDGNTGMLVVPQNIFDQWLQRFEAKYKRVIYMNIYFYMNIICLYILLCFYIFFYYFKYRIQILC